MKPKCSGFTLVEIVTVLVVLGILAAFSIPAISNSLGVSELHKNVSKVKSYIQYAQTKAMSSNTVWGVHYDGNEFWLFSEEKDNTELLPSESKEKISFSRVDISDLETLTFDKWGKPYTDVDQENELGSDLSITIFLDDSGESKQLSITPETGYIKDGTG